MNFKDYAKDAITIEQIGFGPNRNVDVTQLAAITIRRDYPVPKYGVQIAHGPRGDTQNHIDWQVGHLRNTLAAIMESVVEDCLSVIESQGDYPALVKALRDHFQLSAN